MAVLVLRTWYVETGDCTTGSMAAALLGVHREVTCGDCGCPFVCGADLSPVSARAVCPNCGYAGNDLEARPDLAGDRVLIDKPIYQFRPPRRWEVVAFRHPEQTSRTLVKRVVGLPGESIQIRQGEVYINGQIRPKTLAEQRALAILVHDADYQPRSDPNAGPGWQGGENSRWISSDSGCFACAAASGRPPDEDWLEYRHVLRLPGGAGEVRPSPVTDVCGYNQTRPRRTEDVRPVRDLMLSLRLVKTSGPGRLLIRATDGREEFRVGIEPRQRRYEVFRNGGSAVPAAAGELPSLGGGTTLEVSLFDRQFLLAFDGRTVATIGYGPSPPPQQPTSRPFAIESQGGLGAEVRDLRVYRDVYYTHPNGLRGRWGLDEPFRLGADQFFVLGDNSPISEDSRTWAGGPVVNAKLLIGKPLLVHFPARTVELGRWRFQVPHPGRIRYIR